MSVLRSQYIVVSSMEDKHENITSTKTLYQLSPHRRWFFYVILSERYMFFFFGKMKKNTHKHTHTNWFVNQPNFCFLLLFLCWFIKSGMTINYSLGLIGMWRPFCTQLSFPLLYFVTSRCDILWILWSASFLLQFNLI